METANLTNASINCGDEKIKLRIKKSDIENILRLMLQYTTNVVEMELTIHSKNETRSFPKYKWSWASEIGRTIISLIARPFIKILGVPPSSLNFITLRRGIEKVNVAVFEEIEGCLPTGSDGSELVFDFLLHQLSHSDDTHDYKLCRPHADEDGLKQYNCCRITSGELSVCGDVDYISDTIDEAGKCITIITCVIVFFGLPLIIQYLRVMNARDKRTGEKKKYEISDSPLALKTILYTLFIEGHGEVKSFARRFFFLLTAALLHIISTSSVAIQAISGSLVFLAPWDIFSIGKDVEDDEYDDYILTITSPFNVNLWSKCLTFDQSQSRWKKILCICFFPILFCTVSFLSILSSGFAVLVGTFYILPYTQIKSFPLYINVPKLFAPAVAIWCINAFASFLNMMLAWMAGIYLNGQFFSPYFTAIMGVVIYSLKHWRWSIEAKYLVLKTNIYEVCKEMWEKNKNNEANPDEEIQPGTFDFNIKDGKVPKALYKEIRKLNLPFHRLLFHFFAKIFIVASFFVVVLVMMLLAQNSKISGPVQIISTIAASTLPFIFDTLWTEDTFEQKNAYNIEQQRNIKGQLTLVARYDTEIRIRVHERRVEDIDNNTWRDVFFIFNPIMKRFYQSLNSSNV
ncbi:uncharacterized protein LOC114524097 [Dendronephthya gigantea]|uniref:uncharacterized protein LOC114524097 n=1 Tax=Dendronephthya gigantea TaxID=151771 RepID=UPI0010692856|nr:uncharacterized protein LOC114524097 [Dendronephthya gigantea]